MGKIFRGGLVLGLACVAFLGLAGDLQAARYTFHNLGALGEEYGSRANAINDQGQVAGEYGVWQGTHAVRWTTDNPLKMEDLGTLGGTVRISGEAYGINNLGQVVGDSINASDKMRSFFWTTGEPMHQLGVTEDADYIVMTFAHGISDAGQIVGMIEYSGYYTFRHPYWWEAGPTPVQHLLPLWEAFDSGGANTINQHSQVGGWYKIYEYGYKQRACLWTIGEGYPEDLGTLGGDYSTAVDINNLGEVVGTAKTEGGVPHAFLWTPDKGIEDLTPTSGQSSAIAINDAGKVLGHIVGVGDFIWTRANGIKFLQDLVVDLPEGVILGTLCDMNNRGEIVGDALHLVGPGHYLAKAMLLIPIPELPVWQILLLD